MEGIKGHIRVKDIVYIIVIIVLLVVGSNVISKYNYNDYIKSVREKGKTFFSRDKEEKYSSMKSYKLENRDYNDAMFSKTIDVKPNTPYKITCMVKTENVENEKNIYTGGAQIGIKDTTECSESITGTTDWTEVTFMLNSKNRESVEIGFRLGGFEEKSKGTAWFSDLKIEEGSLDSDNTWKMGCFIIQNVDINVDLDGKNTNLKLSMSENDIYDIKSNMDRIPATIRNLTKREMDAECEVITIKEPLKKISYDKENEYFVSPSDVKELIDKYVKKNEYDYIYVAIRLGDINKSKEILVHDWIGLGGMDYYGVGFSNIRLPDSTNSYIYKYNSSINTFPEEVFIHEFLHTLERNEKEYGNTNLVPLHDFEKFGYKTEKLIGLQNWYIAYMQNTIKNDDGTNAGLSKNIYTSKPIHESNFKYSYELNSLKEPSNLIEEINIIINKVKLLFTKK